MRDYKIFYSWQSDLPNSTNRSFIEKALENTAKSIRADDSIKVEPVIDRDTAGVPGSPDIAGTIFAKIEESQVFVCDVSIINEGEKSRPTPNPNVLIELGYALKTLGSERILMVMNTVFGKPELLPFDLSRKRVVTYYMPEEYENRATERKKLEAQLDTALRTILTQIKIQPPERIIPSLSIGDQTRAAVENAQPNQVLSVRRFMEWLTDEIETLQPDFSKDGERDDLFIEALDKTKQLILEFARLAEVVAIINTSEVALSLFKAFKRILEHYNVPRGFSGVIPENDFDFYKFIGHELFVTFFSFLIRENRWEIIADILEERVYIENVKYGRTGLVSFDYISQDVGLLGFRNQRLKLNRISVHADILKERHTKEDLGKLVPMQQFMDADFFLFLRGEFEKSESGGRTNWRAWSTVYMEYHTPGYLVEAVRVSYAKKLLRPFGIDTIEKFRSRLLEIKTSDRLARTFGNPFYFDLDNPIENLNPQSIGSH